MGNATTSFQFKKWLLSLQELQLSNEEMKFLHRLYCGGETPQFDSLTIEVLVRNLNIKNSKDFAYQLFAEHDVGGVGMVTFPEFVFALVRFCTQPPEELGKSEGQKVLVISTKLCLTHYQFV